MKTPDGWPKDCPGDVPEVSGTYYRLVLNNPPLKSDFESYHELGWQPDRDPCLRCSLSVFRKKKEAAHMKRLFKRVNLGNYVAEGVLAPEHGSARFTPGKEPSHTSWWPCEGIDRAALFTVVEDLR